MKQSRFAVGDRKQVNFYYSKSDYKKFVERFPNLTSLFLSKCLERATKEKYFFECVMCDSMFELKEDF